MDAEMITKIDKMMSESHNQYEVNQRFRVIETIKYADKFDVIHGNVLNIGGGDFGTITDSWKYCFPNAKFIPTTSNLQNPLPFPDNSFDSIICCEVFEHIGDRNFMSSHSNFAGPLNLLNELMRVLKPEKKFLLTTPNVTSINNLRFLLLGGVPFTYCLHYREYSRYEIECMLAFLKIDTICFDALDVFLRDKRIYKKIYDFLARNNFPIDDRGDMFCIIGEKSKDWQFKKLPEKTAHIVYPGNKRNTLSPWNYSHENPELQGGARYCNICGYRFSNFLPFGMPAREAKCPHCGSLERHRHLYIHIASLFPFLQNKSILHFAPEQILKKIFLMSNAEYIDADIDLQKATHQIDITNISFDDQRFDYIFCIHVLEHIPDDLKAMRELYRVLKPGGIAYLCVPLRKTFHEDLTITDPKERTKLYGHHYHVRNYDFETFRTRLSDAGFNTDIVSYPASFPAGLADALLGDPIFLARKL